MSDVIGFLNFFLLLALPFGNPRVGRRYPKITLALIAVNTAIYFLSFHWQWMAALPAVLPQMELQQIEQPLLTDWLKSRAGEKTPEDYWEELEPREAAQLECEFYRDLEAGRILERGSAEYREWSEARETFISKRDRLPWFRFGFRPKSPSLLSALTGEFLHGDFWHLFWNMYFLWMVGVNLEIVWGRRFFLPTYLLGGLAANLADYLVRVGSCWDDIPGIGASGAIFAILGAFGVRFWDTKVRFYFFTREFWLPIWVPLSGYVARQFYYGFYYFNDNVSINFWAHIGGFLFGAAVAGVVMYFRLESGVIARELHRQDDRDLQHSEEGKAAAQQRPLDLELGIEARKYNRLEEAREHLERAAQDFPLDLDVHFELQQVLQRLNLPTEANAHQGVVIGVLLELGQPGPALERYRLLKQAAPAAVVPGPGQYKIARLLEAEKDWLLAADAYRAFALASPDDEGAPKALFSAAELLHKRLGRPDKAAAMLEFIRTRYPGHAILEHVETALARLREEAQRRKP